MNTVKVNKHTLFNKLLKNRATHIKEAAEAKIDYKKAVIKDLETKLKKAKAGKRVDLLVRIPQPENHKEDYDRAIEMLEMSVETNIELSANEFDQYVKDNWHWKHQFSASNMLYKNVR